MRLEDDLYERLRNAAFYLRIPHQKVFTDALTEWLRKLERENHL